MRQAFLVFIIVIAAATCLYAYGNMRPDLRLSMKSIVAEPLASGTEIATVAGSSLITITASTIVTP